MFHRFFSLCGISLVAFMAFLTTDTLNAGVGPRTIVYNLSDLHVHQDGAYRLADCPCKKKRGDYVTAATTHCPCGPGCNCPADCGCRFGGPCTHHQMNSQGNQPTNPAFANRIPYGYGHMGCGEPIGYGYSGMGYDSEPMGYRGEPMGYGYGPGPMGYGGEPMDYGYEPAGFYGQQMPYNMGPVGSGYGMPQGGYDFIPCELDPPCCNDQEMFCCEPMPIKVNRNNRRQLNRRGRCCCKAPVGVVYDVHPYDETWEGWYVYSLFNNVHDCCRTVPSSCYHYFPHFTRGQWHTITCNCDYYIKHLRAGSSH